MKQCPKCGTTYTDASLRFCLTDGTPLSEIRQEETVLNQVPPTVHRSGSTVKKAVLIIGITAVLFVSAGIMAALILYSNIDKNRQRSAATPTAAATRSPSPTPNAETEKLKGELANLQQKLEEQKAANANAARQPRKMSDNEAPVARVDSPNDGFLSLRSEPDADLGERIAKIPHGATVELQNCEKDEVTVAGRRGRWCQVTYGGDTGYVFDAWLVY